MGDMYTFIPIWIALSLCGQTGLIESVSSFWAQVVIMKIALEYFTYRHKSCTLIVQILIASKYRL